ncbi:MAG TPA: hypothetical protein VD738_07825 [Nitrospira sp.]|nr:hypothetical protein [Nitrospira sp.]
MTPPQAAAALFNTMPQPISGVQLEEYGIGASEADTLQIAREIVSLNLYWILAAIDAHIPLKYRPAIRELLFEAVRTRWWESGRLGTGTWDDYQQEVEERRAVYGRLVDEEGLSHMAVCAEAASRIEDQGSVSSEDRHKLLVLLIDYAPAAEYGKLLDEVG